MCANARVRSAQGQARLPCEMTRLRHHSHASPAKTSSAGGEQAFALHRSRIQRGGCGASLRAEATQEADAEGGVRLAARPKSAVQVVGDSRVLDPWSWSEHTLRVLTALLGDWAMRAGQALPELRPAPGATGSRRRRPLPRPEPDDPLGRGRPLGGPRRAVSSELAATMSPKCTFGVRSGYRFSFDD